jgi:hypothetical protein
LYKQEEDLPGCWLAEKFSMSLKKIACVLAYPGHEVLQDINEKVCREIRRFVSFLEHRIIRLYPITSRDICSETLENEQWLILFQKYLQDLGCPFAPESKSLDAQMQWLSGHAISLHFEDLPEASDQQQMGKELQQSATKLVAASTASASDTSVFDSELRALAHTLHIPIAEEPLNHAQRLLILHSIEGLIQRLSNKGNPISIDCLSSGLEVKSKKVEKAAIIIRMLHLEEMRIIQNQINCVLEQAQSFVSNPKTDSSLGRVGI